MNIDDIYKRKQTIEETEAEMNEMDVKHGKKAYSEDANVDEAIPIQIIKKGRKSIQRDNEPRYQNHQQIWEYKNS